MDFKVLFVDEHFEHGHFGENTILKKICSFTNTGGLGVGSTTIYFVIFIWGPANYQLLCDF